MRQTFDIASTLLDEMTKINRAWYTREDQVSPLNLGLTNEQLKKNQERDENMAKIMIQMDLLTKHVMESGYKVVNAVGANSMSPNEMQFEDRYNEEVHFLSNQAGGSHLSYPRSGGNQGWNRDCDDGWRDRDRDWCDRDMARPKLLVRGLAPRKKEKGVIITTGVTPPRATHHKPPQGSVKGKGKKRVVASSISSSLDSMGIDSTHLTSFESEREEVVGSRTPIHTLATEGELLKRKHSKLRSKDVHDPLARLPVLSTPLAPTTT
uniref:Integrase core domain containing protein n=1 Tax=Solanum tuberosum TaxID=4113 RepID=M1DXZ1_SOLTU